MFTRLVLASIPRLRSILVAEGLLASVSRPVTSEFSAVTSVKYHNSTFASRTFASVPETKRSAADTLLIDGSAVTRLKELAAEAPGAKVFLRIEVEGGGCSGFQYKFNLDNNLGPDDIIFEKDGVSVVCDNISYAMLKGSKIEFEDSLMRSAFVVSSNPNSESSCGCGNSFVAKMK